MTPRLKTENRLYGGMFQADFEVRVFRNFVRRFPLYNTPTYPAVRLMTYFSTDLNGAIFDLTNRDPDSLTPGMIPREDKPGKWPFTRYPIILEVDAKKLHH